MDKVILTRGVRTLTSEKSYIFIAGFKQQSVGIAVLQYYEMDQKYVDLVISIRDEELYNVEHKSLIESMVDEIYDILETNEYFLVSVHCGQNSFDADYAPR